MPFDAVTLAAVAAELNEKAVGGRIQGVFLPAPLAVGLEIYAQGETRYLFVSAHPQHARVHLSESKLTRGTEDVTPLLLLLRKYVRDGRLLTVQQPPLERVLSLIISKADVFDKGMPEGDSTPPLITTVTLIIEIMGRYSNIILVDDSGLVLEAIKHVSADINRYRVTLPRHPYAPPPPQSKADPRTAGAADMARTLAQADDQPAWQTLMRSYLAVSPLLAREAVFRAAGDAGAAASQVAPDAIAAALSSLLAPPGGRWSPTLAREKDDILEFAPYVLTQFGARTFPAESISVAIHAYYAQETVATEYAGLKQDVQKALNTQRGRVQRRKESLEKQQQAGKQAESLRTKGEMLLACATQITPRQREAVIEMAPGEAALRIALNELLSPVENAQEYFRRYAQARDAARSVPPLLAQAALDLAYLDQLQLDLELAGAHGEVREVQQALADAATQRAEARERTQDREGKEGRERKGNKRGKENKEGKPKPPARQAFLTLTSDDGMEIVVGRNARQNDYVTFELASALDMWLHARGVAGSHVIIRCGARPVSQKTLTQAAALAAAYSAGRGAASVVVAYTQRRNVHRARGGGPGLVTCLNEKTLHVAPAPR